MASPVETKLDKLKTFRDISALSMHQLNKECKANSVKTQFSKTAKINLLCLALGISTCGQDKPYSFNPRMDNHGLTSTQLQEYSRLTPAYLARTGSWTKELQCLPPVDDSTVKSYLLNSKVFDKDQHTKYKLQRPFQMKDFVHSIKINLDPSETFIAIEAQCNSSQSGATENVKALYIILDKITGQPYGAYCTCTVGLYQSCAHVGATLFQLADLVSMGFTQLPDDPTCTEKLCAWTDPKSAKVEPQLYNDIKFTKTERNVRRTADNFGPKVATVNEDARVKGVSVLRQGLLNATQHMNQHVAATSVLTPANFGGIVRPPATPVLPVHITTDSPLLVPARFEATHSQPAPLATQPISKHMNVSDYIKSCKTDEKERREVEAMTRGQNQNLKWYAMRSGTLTTTKFYRVSKLMQGGKASPSRLVSDCMGDKYKNLTKPPQTNIKSLKWGITHESAARTAYFNMEKTKHKNLTIKETGLIMHPTKSYLRASPDGIVLCKCCPPRILEIKCPYSAANEKIRGNPKIKYIEQVDNTLVLKGSDSGYVEQVQGCMAITNVYKCDFVIYTVKDIVVIRVDFDQVFWRRLEQHLDSFFEQYVVPELFRRQGHPDAIYSLDDSSEADIEEDVNANITKPETQPASDDETSQKRKLDEKHCSESKTRKTQVSDDLPKHSDQTDDTVTYCVGPCKQALAEAEDILDDNSNASVGCECPCECEAWSCWTCAGYNEDMADNDILWYCAKCLKDCGKG
ncbi:uncharacterized protein LOC118411645 isoform X2 [Branchiostoma floridae]|uniref:Uncharacterized protein LOC118411645 isoform X2 n=1 Tax=Branchiostoma floridae TaxID=7739 RepID=A0A9J7KTS7_BRAFL|nr:uncharacterized protein LOC118411645 isoform X2 [Branchiostoma floridae]